MAKNRYDSKRIFPRRPGGPWYAWLCRRGKAVLEARLGYAEAAALLGLKVPTLRTLVHRGQIPRPMTSTLETVKRPKPRPMTFTIETAKRPRPRSTPKQAKRRTQ